MKKEIKCVKLVLCIFPFLWLYVFCIKLNKKEFYNYINVLLVKNNVKQRYKTINICYGRKKTEKENYDEYFKKLDKIFNECEYDEEQVEKEEKDNEDKIDLAYEQDLLNINFCNYENDPRSLSNLVKNKSKEEIEREKLEEKQNLKDNKETTNNTLPYSYDYDRIFKNKKFLQEKIHYKDKFSLKDDKTKLIDTYNVNIMNEILNNHQNDSEIPFYKGRRDKYFGREDEPNCGEDVKENYLVDDLESVNFLRKIKSDFHFERDEYIQASIKQIEESYVKDGNGNIYENGGEIRHGNKREIEEKEEAKEEGAKEEGAKEGEAKECISYRIRNYENKDVINKMLGIKFVKMFSVDDEVKKINEKIKTSKNINEILDIFSKEKRLNIINIMYIFIYMYRYKNININEYLYDKRLRYITDGLEELLKHYLYIINNSGCIKLEKKTIILNDVNIIMLIKYMNRLKLFYINLNIYNMIFLILSKSLELFTLESMISLLAYINEYSYYDSEIHRKINLTILRNFFKKIKKDFTPTFINKENEKFNKTDQKLISFSYFKLLIPILLKYKYVDKIGISLLYSMFEENIKKILFNDKNIVDPKEECDILFYNAKTKDQKKNKENYFSYLKYEHLIEKKKNLHFLSQFLHYIIISKFYNDKDRLITDLVNIFINNFQIFNLNDILNIYFNFHIFNKFGNNFIFRCKQEILHRKSTLKDSQINKILSYIIYNYKKSKIFKDYHRHIFVNRKYTLCRNKSDIKQTNIVSYSNLIKKRKELKSFKRLYITYKNNFEDSQFVYDFTNNINMFVQFQNINLLRFIYNMYILSLLFYKNQDVIRIVSDLIYDMTETNIFSFIDQYSYYMYEDIYIIIKSLKYISFFDINLIDIWKKFFFLLNHFINSLNLENIYDIFFFINISKLTNLKSENYDVVKLLTNRMKEIIHQVFNLDIKNLNTHPHTYILNILNLVTDHANQDFTSFVHFFFYSIYKKIEQKKNEQKNSEQKNSEQKNSEINDGKIADGKLHDVYKGVNNYVYNFKDIRLFIKYFLLCFKENQEGFNNSIVDFILWNSEIFFSKMNKNKNFYHNNYIFGNEINEYISFLHILIKKKIYNSISMRRYINIFKNILFIQEYHNDNSNLTNESVYKQFVSKYSEINDINIWKFIRNNFYRDS
ncbi:conserved Plasmodium protein, unknown function [Plasmodium yoelii]|uniref:Uncharacterized protein n=2 Tax=Plasmodium yoelii TaxID=5861 RepID=A0AAE9WQV1_PLAYO|nr:conserved Plasmodium protein, unknown function [Plasmodium yoelii]WBY56784.1 hypothetical protein Py17XNL_000801808 [Plasmodium yoelii yoelii]CDU17607.1 conserved Plasmodium protein, unknown function [Plasmodium yoelii]VTZ77492.1 conserved Plasmodium protein, unknown function [Plasmodium yoelii]|eukprot:XP_022811978.1 conserved Plasmodium protein, unknown function [Plasmodium yoelii]